MKISYNWIKDYLKIDLDPHKVAEILTAIGLEIESVEEWESVKGGLAGVVIGEVVTCKKHPAADKLSVTTVNIGNGEPLNIVCGAPNVAAGQKVPVATAGTIVFKGEEQLEIKKSRIRGELSEGMICAEDELGLGTAHQGIMVLRPDAVIGTPASEYFKTEKDFVFEIGLTPNRIDSGSHFGVARDLAAYLSINQGFKLKATKPSVDSFNPERSVETFEILVENPIDCPRYSGINISDVTIAESPEWLKNRLKAIGQNPINNVVDISNYVQHEIGQPLHTFDSDKISGKKVIIRNLPGKSKFITFDDIVRELSSRDLMICNAEEGMCIAGVFGGTKSGVTAATKNIFLESAYFNPVSIRKTARRHGLHTDASFRFERGADPNITVWALKRAALMIRDIAGGKLTSDVNDIYPVPVKNATVEVSYKNINRLIGKVIEPPTVKKILGLLDIKILSETSGNLNLDIPAYRVDVHREADVIEEILRIYGYNNIEINNHVNSTVTYIEKPDKEKAVNSVSNTLTANGFAEIMSNSLTPSAWYDNSDDFDSEQLVKLANPLSSDLNAMRQSLLFGGLSSIAWNINRQNYDLKLYEFGNCYFFKKGKPSEKPVKNFSEKTDLDLFITGNKGKQSWNTKSEPTDFFLIKSFVEMILCRLGISYESLAIAESNKKYFTESLSYLFNNMIIAETGRLSKIYTRRFEIDQDVFYGHIEWDSVFRLIGKHTIQYRELPKYPSVKRDLALLLDKGVKFSQVRSLAHKTERNILKDVSLFDVYESDSLGKNKKSYAVSFILQDELRTLTDKNIDKVMNSFVRIFEKELGAKIR
ncbi:MAG: phenylalanine--tRNA ligase subunit beta [Odoribacter sp.]|nr:phenylalanine--tRNA ligase subunit beta [Odoribacter sp.]